MSNPTALERTDERCVVCGGRTVSTVGSLIDGAWHCYNCAEGKRSIPQSSNPKIPELPAELRRAAKISTSGYWAGVLLEAADEIEAARRGHETKAEHPDEARLDLIAAEYLHLIPFDMPTGQGDADVGWRALQSHMGKPEGVEIACVYRDDIREAIDMARRALKSKARHFDPSGQDGGEQR